MDLFKYNNREVIFYGVWVDRHGQKSFTYLESLPRCVTDIQNVGWIACGYKRSFDKVFAISNSEKLKDAWYNLAHCGCCGPEDNMIFLDFLEHLVEIGEGMKF